MPNSEMIDTLCSEPKGVIFACNIIDTYSANFIPNTTLNDYFQSVLSNFTNNDYDTASDIIGLFWKQARKFKKRKPFFERITPSGSSPSNIFHESISYFNVMKWEYFRRFYIDRKNWEKKNSPYLLPSYNENPSSAKFQDFLKNHQSGNFKLKGVGYIGGSSKGSHFWITNHQGFYPYLAPWECIRNCRNIGRTFPDIIRDLLGLSHYASETLVAVKYPGKLLKKYSSARPLFADTGAGNRFKAISEKERNNHNKSNWGKTICLYRLKKNDDDIESVEERIVEVIPQRDVKEDLEYMFFGTTSIHSSASDEMYANWLLNNSQMDIIGIKKELKRIIC